MTIVPPMTVANSIDHLKKDGRFRLVKHTKNLGPGAARNTGIRTSSGKWITFADADDFYCDNDFLQKAHDLLLNAKCDMLLFDHVEYDESVNEFVCSAHRRFLFNVNDKHLNHVWDEGERNKYLFEIPPFPFTKIISRNAILKMIYSSLRECFMKTVHFQILPHWYLKIYTQ